MKTKNLLFAMLVAPAVFTACSNEDFAEQAVQNAEIAIPGEDITLVFSGDADTRMEYTPGTPGATGAPGSYKWQLPGGAPYNFDNAIDLIGLSRVLTGVATTNYAFYPTAVRSLGQNAWIETASAEGTGAKFKTEQQTVFAGDYVAYYPYNKDFVSDGPVKLTLEQAQVQSQQSNADHVAEYGFAVSDIITLDKGGEQVDKNFVLQQLYGQVYFRLKGVASSNVPNFLSVSLESDEEIFPVEATLDVATLQTKAAADLTAEDLTVTKKVNHIDLTLTTKTGQLNTGSQPWGVYYMTLMPGTYTGVNVVYRTATGYKSEALPAFTVKPGQFLNVDRTLDGAEFNPYQITDQLIVNDVASWKTALEAVATVSNTTRVISVNAPITLTKAELFATSVDASRTAKVVVRGAKITVKGGGSEGTGVFTNVVFENEVSIDKNETALTIPAANVTFENLDADNANNDTKWTLTANGNTVLNLKDAKIRGEVEVAGTAKLNVIDGGTVTTAGNVTVSAATATLAVEDGATWNVTRGTVVPTGALDIDGAWNINGGTITMGNTCDFTNGTVTINGGSVKASAIDTYDNSVNTNLPGTITNKGGVVYVVSTEARLDMWASSAIAGASADFINAGGDYYVTGLTTPSVLNANARRQYAQATGFEFTQGWTITDVNESYDYDMLLNATAAITIEMPQNATCTVEGDIIVTGTNLVKIYRTGTTGNEGVASTFNAQNVTVNGKLQIGNVTNDKIKLNCTAVYVNRGATFSWASNVTGCIPEGNGKIND